MKWEAIKVIDEEVVFGIEYTNDTKFVRYTFIGNVKMLCDMDFSLLPHDTQQCSFVLYSLALPEVYMNFTSIEYYVYFGKEGEKKKNLQNFEVTVKDLDFDNFPALSIFGEEQPYAVGGFYFVLKRLPFSYTMKYVMPCTAAVVASWVSFLIPPDIVPGRVGLLVTLFLVAMTIFGSIITGTPSSSRLEI